MKKQQILLIRGGQTFNTYDEYLDHLRTRPLPDPTKNHPQNWKYVFSERLDNKYQLIMPQMPCSKNITYEAWKIWLERHFPFLQDDIILIGNSLGGSLLAKYLTSHTFPKKIHSLHLIAAPFGDLTKPQRKEFSLPSSLDNIRQQVDKIHLYYSKDDPHVAWADFQAYAQALPDAHQHIFTNKGHFDIEEFPELVEIIKKG